MPEQLTGTTAIEVSQDSIHCILYWHKGIIVHALLFFLTRIGKKSYHRKWLDK